MRTAQALGPAGRLMRRDQIRDPEVVRPVPSGAAQGERRAAVVAPEPAADRGEGGRERVGLCGRARQREGVETVDVVDVDAVAGSSGGRTSVASAPTYGRRLLEKCEGPPVTSACNTTRPVPRIRFIAGVDGGLGVNSLADFCLLAGPTVGAHDLLCTAPESASVHRLAAALSTLGANTPRAEHGAGPTPA